MKNKNYYVFRKEFGQVQYLTEFNKTAWNSKWSMEQSEAKRLTMTQAWRIATKLNDQLDAGTPKRYGYSDSVI